MCKTRFPPFTLATQGGELFGDNVYDFIASEPITKPGIQHFSAFLPYLQDLTVFFKLSTLWQMIVHMLQALI